MIKYVCDLCQEECDPASSIHSGKKETLGQLLPGDMTHFIGEVKVEVACLFSGNSEKQLCMSCMLGVTIKNTRLILQEFETQLEDFEAKMGKKIKIETEIGEKK